MRSSSAQPLYTRAQELIFPPCTCLSTAEFAAFGRKKCVLLTAQVSTARPDTRDLDTPTYVPGTRAAMGWLKGLAGEVENEEVWDLSKMNLSAVEHVAHLALLIGRARAAVPNLRSLNLTKTQLTAEGLAALAEGLPLTSITSLKCAAAERSAGKCDMAPYPTCSLFAARLRRLR